MATGGTQLLRGIPRCLIFPRGNVGDKPFIICQNIQLRVTVIVEGASKKLKQEELARRKAEQEEENLTPEQKLAEKLRLQKLQEESDLKTALETFGVTTLAGGIDGMHPTTKEEFVELADAITKKLSNYKSDPEYTNFLEDLVTKIFASLPSANIRKVKGILDNLFLEKQKLEKGDKPKKSKGGKIKARLRMDGENTNFDEYPTKYDDYDEFDDFM
ncbi:eukaryotic translation initiation factor 3 subunit J-like [Malaya genurostris]|uniref:eukaryotic translation initiation factor 3 subunit J-like n=1 Tax=Malaya genurostris TaxID=325434 RepID=UPI0026F3E707|nr:eukaryotic translation initiation factor 3 subunit J-like [Malaya genurostris]